MDSGKPIMCPMGLRPVLMFGWCDVHSDAAVRGQASEPANERWDKQFNVSLLNNTALLCSNLLAPRHI